MKSLIISIFLMLSLNLNAQDILHKSDDMKQILKEISIKAIALGDYSFDFTTTQIDSTWIGYQPTIKSDIEKAEKQLGIDLPKDYIDFLLITNGFHAANSVEPSFCAINKIDYLKNVDSDLYEIWIETGNIEVGNKLKTAIKIGGFDEEQYFFLIPPSPENPNWEYWVFATWAPGETIYASLLEYFNAALKTTNSFIENKTNNK